MDLLTNGICPTGFLFFFFFSVQLNEKCVSFEEQQLKEILMTARTSTEKDKKITTTVKTKGLC